MHELWMQEWVLPMRCDEVIIMSNYPLQSKTTLKWCESDRWVSNATFSRENILPDESSNQVTIICFAWVKLFCGSRLVLQNASCKPCFIFFLLHQMINYPLEGIVYLLWFPHLLLFSRLATRLTGLLPRLARLGRLALLFIASNPSPTSPSLILSIRNSVELILSAEIEFINFFNFSSSLLISLRSDSLMITFERTSSLRSCLIGKLTCTWTGLTFSRVEYDDALKFFDKLDVSAVGITRREVPPLSNDDSILLIWIKRQWALSVDWGRRLTRSTTN